MTYDLRTIVEEYCDIDKDFKALIESNRFQITSIESRRYPEIFIIEGRVIAHPKPPEDWSI